MKFNLEKFSRLVQYICHHAPPEKFGSVKLNKVIWVSEKYWYDIYGETATGETFIHKDQGPVCKHMIAVLDLLKNEKKIKITPGKDYEPTIYRCKHSSDVSDYPADFIDAVDVFRKTICNEHTSQTISVDTHDWLWKTTDDGQPMSLAAYYRKDVSSDDKAWADTCSM